jgi:hypothetical protein
MVCLIPVLSLGIDTHDSEGERFLYLPSIFFLVVIVDMIFSVFRNIKYVMMSVVLYSLFCLFWLAHFASEYKYAARITKASLHAIKEAATYESIYAIQLPSQYRGALIFRSGFENALKWICPDLAFDNIHIVSQQDVLNRRTDFSVKNITYDEWINSRPRLENDEGKTQVPAFGNSESHKTRGNLILYWTDSSLVKVKLP